MSKKNLQEERTLSQIEYDLIQVLADEGSDKARELFLEWQEAKNKRLERVVNKIEQLATEDNCAYCGRSEPCEGSYPEGCLYQSNGATEYAQSLPVAGTEGNPDVTKAIADLERFSKTHRDWAEYFENNPDAETKYVATGEWDTAEVHRQIIADYDNVISILKSVTGTEPYGYVFENHFYKSLDQLSGQTFSEGNEPVAVYREKRGAEGKTSIISEILKYWHTYSEDEIELIRNKLKPVLERLEGKTLSLAPLSKMETTNPSGNSEQLK